MWTGVVDREGATAGLARAVGRAFLGVRARKIKISLFQLEKEIKTVAETSHGYGADGGSPPGYRACA